MSPPRRERIRPGRWVLVRDGRVHRFRPGFVVEAVVDGGYRVRRLRDDVLLPGVVPESDVRPVALAPARTRSTDGR